MRTISTSGTVIALQELEQVPGDGSFHAPSDLAWALAIAPAAGRVGTRGWVVAQPHQRHGMQRPVELAITAAVQPVTGDLPEDAGIGATPASAANA
jgi:hypothetical protein